MKRHSANIIGYIRKVFRKVFLQVEIPHHTLNEQRDEKNTNG